VFVIGDTASIAAPTRNLLGFSTGVQPLPGVAQPAIQEGKYVARVIRRRITGQSPPAPFTYWDKGSLAIVGRTFAVADLHFVRFSGVTAWLLWIGIHIYFLIGFANRLLVMLQWGISFWTKRRGVRIFPLDRRAEMPGKQNLKTGT
jgi:NADH dehydrogenase